MDMPFRCDCGSLKGRLETRRSAGRARCYCRDCQAYARYLGREQALLDGNGGTEIIACVPGGVQFTVGVDRLACVSLGERGLLRWHAQCCRTPIGNTPRGSPQRPRQHRARVPAGRLCRHGARVRTGQDCTERALGAVPSTPRRSRPLARCSASCATSSALDWRAGSPTIRSSPAMTDFRSARHACCRTPSARRSTPWRDAPDQPSIVTDSMTLPSLASRPNTRLAALLVSM